jgi:nicotinamidase-related amidase
LAHARLMGMPVAYTRWLGSTFNPATRFSGWIKGFEPYGSDSIFERKQPSCYASQHFAEVMTNNNGNFIIAGFAGEAACLSTAIDAFHRGHHVTYLSDASASHGLADRPSMEVHDFVRQLMGLWGNVMRTETWIRTTSRVVAWKEAAMLGGRA